MRAHEFITESQKVHKGQMAGIDLIFRDSGEHGCRVEALANGRLLGWANFERDGKILVAEELEVDGRYRGQGIAKIMYDYVKSLGFTIERSENLTADGMAFWDRYQGSRAIWEKNVVEGVDIATAIENTVDMAGGTADEYFVRFTDVDKLGYSARQHFGRTPDIGDKNYDPDALPRPGQGRPALWFYPLKTYLKNPDLYAADKPYVWLVRIKPNAYLQSASDKERDSKPNLRRAGIIKQEGGLPIAVFFKPEFDVIDRWYDYGSQHRRQR